MQKACRKIALIAWTALFCGVAFAAEPAEEPFIWMEGENPTSSEVPTNPWFDEVDTGALSDAAWLSSFSEPDQPAGKATYEVDIPRAGNYHFWIRANPRATGMEYRLDAGQWRKVDVGEIKKLSKRVEGGPRVVQQMPIALDGKWDIRFIAWIYLGTLDLEEGGHTIEFEFDAWDQEKKWGALDCFVLTTGQFEPRRKYRPGQEPQNVIQYSEGETWPFRPERDAFDPAAPLDLGHLNEQTAGEHGFIRLSPDGNDFVRGDGERIRFWAGTTYVQRNAFRRGRDGWEDLRHHARFLAKRGVNMVRWHGALPPRDPDSAITDVNEDQLHQAWRLVAAMKEEGIYCTLSPFWGSHTKIREGWDVPDPGHGSLSGLVFFCEEVQEGYKAWLKALYDRKNPYTETRLADDPAVGIIQLQNEDSMLFYTMQNVRGEARAILRRQYADWLEEKYGSLQQARSAWDGDEHKNDDFEAGEVGLYIVWHFTREAGEQAEGVSDRRLSDQLEFTARTMHAFNAEIERYLREDLGCKQLINAGNWRTVDPVIVDPAERWSYSANQVIGKNHYYSPVHVGINRGWQILDGHHFQDASAIKRPTRLPLNVKQAVGRPFIIPESLWVPPLGYQSEGPLVVAAQSCLTGFDTFYWFATGKTEWQPPGNKWTFSTPMQLGQFPAAALLFRKGYVKEGSPAVYEERGLQNIWGRRSPIIAEGGAWDPNRDAGNLPAESSVQGGVDPLAFLVGPVRVSYEGDPANNRVVELSQYVDKDAKVVRSVTGQIETHYGAGIYKVSAPKAQGVAGFLAEAGEIDLGDVTIECGNDYATAIVVPLDDRHIAESERLLVQIGTRCRPTGWKAVPAPIKTEGGMVEGKRILRVGKPPWQVLNTDLALRVHNPNLTKATRLTINGERAEEVAAEQSGGALTVTPTPNTMYLLLE